MMKNKKKFRIVLKKDGRYYVQERFFFFFWIDMRPYYEKCISIRKEICEEGIEGIKEFRKHIPPKKKIIGYYN